MKNVYVVIGYYRDGDLLWHSELVDDCKAFLNKADAEEFGRANAKHYEEIEIVEMEVIE